jgi:hypothetical protein
LKRSNYYADKPLELVHGGLCGLVKPSTPSGRRYFFLLGDDTTRYMYDDTKRSSSRGECRWSSRGRLW